MAESSIDAVLRVQRIIYLALVSSLGIYGFVAYTVAQQGGAPVPTAFAYALGFVAAVEMATIPLLRQRLLPPQRPPTSLGEAAPAVDDAARGALARLQSAQIVTWALCESIAILGLVLAFLGRDARWYFAFGALSAVNYLLYRPTGELVAAVVRGAR